MAIRFRQHFAKDDDQAVMSRWRQTTPRSPSVDTTGGGERRGADGDELTASSIALMSRLRVATAARPARRARRQRSPARAIGRAKAAVSAVSAPAKKAAAISAKKIKMTASQEGMTVFYHSRGARR